MGHITKCVQPCKGRINGLAEDPPLAAKHSFRHASAFLSPQLRNEGSINDTLLACHSERSVTESKNPVALPKTIARACPALSWEEGAEE